MKIVRASIMLLPILFLTSCIRPVQLENLGIVLSRGVDVTDDGEVEVTMAVLQFVKDEPSATKTVSGKGTTIKAAVKDANKKVNQEIVVGKIELQIFGNKAAVEGLHPYLDTLRRDANIPNTLLLAVSEGKSKDIFEINQEEVDTSIGQFLHGLIQPGIEERIFPAVSLPDFISDLFNTGIDPLLPIMGKEEGIPTITGIALFKDDKQVGQLSLDDEELVKFIEGNVRNDFMDVTLPTKLLSKYLVHPKRAEKRENVNMIFLIEKGSSDIVLKDKEKLQFDTNVDLILNLQEITESYKFDEKKAIQHIEKEVEKDLTKRYEDMMVKLKELNTDPFGYGVMYRLKTKHGNLPKKEWDRLYPKINVDFHVKVKIIRHGEVHR